MQFDPETLQRCWFLAGPTAAGKSATALALASALNAEVVSLDSMALYRGMDIGTAKPSTAEQRETPHHLIDVIEPADEYSVAEYVEHAHTVCTDIIGRGRTPLFTGGTGLYLRGLLRGVWTGPEADWDFRRRKQQEAEERGAEWLHEQLKAVDPQLAQRLHPNDTRRVIRGLEVRELTGTPLSEQQDHPPAAAADRPMHVYWIEPPREWLYERINQRVDQMIERGLVDEVQRLLAAPRPPGRTARQALGYREIIEYLEGEASLEAAIQLTKVRTRQFAKRQHTWFRNLVECQAVPVCGTESPAELARTIIAIDQDKQEPNG